MAWSVHPYHLPLAVPYTWAEGTQQHRDGCLVHWGGWGEVAPPPHEAVDVDAVRRGVTSAVEAWSDPSERARLRGVVSPRVLCGVSTAWWDRLAQDDGCSLATALGDAHGMRPAPRVAVNGLITADAAGVPDQVAAAKRLGISVLKIKCTADREGDLARVEAVRDAAPHATLRLDANRSWDPAWAAGHMEALATFGIDYVEQPVRERAAMRRLQALDLFDVAIDEAATDAAAIRDALQAGDASVAILKPQRLGGPDATIEAMHAATDAGGRAVVTNSLETSIGVHAALHVAALLPSPEACGLATSGFLAQDVAPPPTVRDGHMAVPTAPGLGVVPEVPA